MGTRGSASTHYRRFLMILLGTFSFTNRASLLKPENLYFIVRVLYSVFAHTCDPTMESNRLVQSKESREKGEKDPKVRYRAPAALPVPSQKHHNFI